MATPIFYLVRGFFFGTIPLVGHFAGPISLDPLRDSGMGVVIEEYGFPTS